MNELIGFLNQYAALINFVLFGTIIGFLFQITTQSRTALVDKHTAELAEKDAQMAALATEVSNLRFRIESKDEHHAAKVDVLNHQLAFFQKISALPEDQRLTAIKFEYEEKIRKLEEQITRKEVPTEQARQEISELKEEAKHVSSSNDSSSTRPSRYSDVVQAYLLNVRITSCRRCDPLTTDYYPIKPRCTRS